MSRVETIGDATLYLGDCREILPTLGKVDAVVTDPPYGMDYNTNTTRFTGPRGGHKKNWGGIGGDKEPFDPAPFLRFTEVIMWGSNHYAARLPVGTTLVWIKRKDAAFGTFLSDAEVGWKKGGHGVYCRRGPFPQSIARTRVHPAQKPVELMEWCIAQIKGEIILDPYMGSGTTGVACINLGRGFIGIERDPAYFDVALSRLKQAVRSQMELAI